MDINLRDQVVYVAALGNNTVEVVDLRNGHLINSIKGLDEPQGVGYIPQHGEIFIANGGNGDCYFYDAHTFEKRLRFICHRMQTMFAMIPPKEKSMLVMELEE